MKIGIFGGSFDPIHIEHIRLAKAAISSLGLDKLYIMPAAKPPHKKGKILSPDIHRLQMCRLAFEDEPKIEVSDYEMQNGGTSYTYLTCRHFKSLHEEAQLFWLVGTDMLRDFPTWKNPESILNDVTLAVCARAEKDGWEEKEIAVFREKFHCQPAVISYNASDVSSTQIRVLAGAGMRLDGLTDEKVAAYIRENHLYEIPFAKDALALQNTKRAQHSLRVAKAAAKAANVWHIPERQAITAALFHDCAKCLQEGDTLLEGFVAPSVWGEVPSPVLHQFAGAYLAEKTFGVTDSDILNAIRFHTSGRENMSELEKLIFLADMLEEERDYEGVNELRALFYAGKSDECMAAALWRSIQFIQKKGGDMYPLTLKAYEFYQKKGEDYGKTNDE